MRMEREDSLRDPICGEGGLSRMRMRRSFLFLQGCTSPFFGRLGGRLEAQGHRVSRINFNVGDVVYWGRGGAWNFRDPVDALPAYLEKKFRTVGFTDVIMLGDTRPLHVAALPVARRFGARVWVFEEGYFRPNWLTLEEGGINGHSRLPKDAEWYREVGSRLPDPGEGVPVKNPVRLLAAHELIYHLPNLANPLLFPGYRTHRPHISGIEFFGWIRRLSRLPLFERRDNARIGRLVANKEPFFLLPLQLDSDSQIGMHSSFSGMHEVIERVMSSFALHAQSDARLVIKNHPLDTGFVDYKRKLAELERRFDVKGRVDYLETGHLPTLLTHTRGVVTVNSTVGTSALVHQCPMVVLGKTIYDLPGLTFQGGLDAFWRDCTRPDDDLFRCFRNTVIHSVQVNGGFYSPSGIDLAVENSLRILEPERTPLEILQERS